MLNWHRASQGLPANNPQAETSGRAPSGGPSRCRRGAGTRPSDAVLPSSTWWRYASPTSWLRTASPSQSARTARSPVGYGRDMKPRRLAAPRARSNPSTKPRLRKSGRRWTIAPSASSIRTWMGAPARGSSSVSRADFACGRSMPTENTRSTSGRYPLPNTASSSPPRARKFRLVFAAPTSRRTLTTPCDDCIPVLGISISIRDVFDEERIRFRVNDPDGALPSPFPVFTSWTRFREDEIFD